MITKVSQLTCDLCGTGELIQNGHNTAARIEAQGRGWKFMSYQGLPTGKATRSTPGMQAKQIDACPGCNLPMPDELVERLKKTAADGS